MRYLLDLFLTFAAKFICKGDYAKSLVILILSLASFKLFAEEPIPGNSAVIEARRLAYNNKIAMFVYKTDYVYHYVGTYKYHSHIRFEPGETIQTLSMSNTTGWEMNPVGNRLFLRPINKNANTNMTLITNKRLYQFIMEAVSVESLDDPKVVFETRFVYPDSSNSGFSSESGITLLNQTSSDELDFSDLSKYNFKYTYSGPDKIAPVRVFDDGEFTYFEFRSRNAEVPAIFYVDNDGYEGLVNFRTQGNYIIVERVSDIFTLRHGSDTICVFNETMKRAPATPKKK